MANTPHSAASQKPAASEPAKPSASAVPEPDISAVPPDFKLAKPGSRDYVAGQPVDEAEFEKTQADAKARKAAGHKSEP